MSTPSPVPDIRGTITLAVPAERAFAVFTDSFGSWWPSEYRIGQAEMADAILEPHAPGGRWYERGTDGSECDWGQVLASEIEVRFTPDGPGQTTVELEHRHLSRLAGGQAIHDMIVQGGGGGTAILERFAKTAESQ